MKKQNKKIIAGTVLALGLSWGLGNMHSFAAENTVEIYHPVKMGSYKNSQEAGNTGIFLQPAGAVTESEHHVKMGSK